MTQGPTPGFPPPPAHEAPLPAALPRPGGGLLLPGLPFAALPGQRPLELDLHLPATVPAPVVVFLHGGGWRVGSRHAVGLAPAGAAASPFDAFVRQGLAVAAVDYRLSGEATWPAQLHDVKAAVRWLRLRAGELGVDGTRIAAWGESAGGHLALLLALTPGNLEGAVGSPGGSSAVSAVVAWYPPTDLPALAPDIGADRDAADSREAQLLGAALPSEPERAAEASPVSHVSAQAPPALLLHGEADRLVPCSQSTRLAALLRDVGADVSLHTYPDADHMWLGTPAAGQDALRRTVAFLAGHLRT